MIIRCVGAALLAGGLFAVSDVRAQNNFVTHEAPTAQPTAPGERPTMVFSAPAYTPNAADSAGQPLSIIPQPAPSYAQPVYPAQQPIPVPVYPAQQPAAPVYPAQQLAPAPVYPAQQSAPAPVHVAPEIQPAPPAAAPVLVNQRPPAQPAAPAPDLRFQQESQTSRTLLALEDVYLKRIKELKAEQQARKTALLDQFEKEAADPEKVVGLAERLRSSMAELEENHKKALAEEDRRYNDARLQVLASSPPLTQ